jgi:hypothetical protein
MIIESRALVPRDRNLRRFWCVFGRQSAYLR